MNAARASARRSRWSLLVLTACVLVGLLACSGTAAADLIDEERSALWEQWREEPLDLRVASVDEIELLPECDGRLALAVVSLRDAGELPGELEVLAQRLGTSVALAEAWRDLVVLGDGAPGPRWSRASDLRTATIVPPTGPVELRAQGRARLGALGVAHGRRGPGTPPGRSWATWTRGELTILGGHLRARTGDGLALADAGTRSRTGRALAPRSPRLEGRSGTTVAEAPVGAGLQWEGERQRAWIALLRAPEQPQRWAGAVAASRAGARVGLSLVAEPGRGRSSLWIARDGQRAGSWWLALGRTPGGWLSHAGTVWSGPTWRVGAAFTRAATPLGAGNDPLTGSLLDREHRASQIDAELRERTWSLELLARRVTRGRPDRIETKERGRVRWEWRPSVGRDARARWRLALESGLDEDLTEPLEETATSTSVQRVRIEREGRNDSPLTRAVVVWRRAGRVGARQEALAVRLDFGHRWPWSLAAALAAGQRSSPWSVVQPGFGSAPLWIEPDGAAVSAAVRVRRVRGCEGGVWTWWREGATRGSEFGAGFVLRLLAGDSGAIVAR